MIIIIITGNLPNKEQRVKEIYLEMLSNQNCQPNAFTYGNNNNNNNNNDYNNWND